MIGSKDVHGVEDVILSHNMTYLEAALYLAILDYGDRSVPAEVADQARHHAEFIIKKGLEFK